jgi:hypothetical protein
MQNKPGRFQYLAKPIPVLWQPQLIVAEVAVSISPTACDAIVQLLPSFAANVFDVVGKVIVVPSVPEKVNELLNIDALPVAELPTL